MRRFTTLFIALLLLLTVPVFAAPPKSIDYTVKVADIPNKTYRVTVTAHSVSEPTVSFAIPAWTPGWYFLTDFEKSLSNFSASTSDTKSLTVTPVNAHTWKVESKGASEVTFSYDLKASDQNFGFFAPYLDATNGFVPGPASLTYVVGGTQVPCKVTYDVPSGWKIASSNDPTDKPNTFSAPNYDFLADQPADLGTFTRYDKTIDGVPFSVIMVGANGEDYTAWSEDVFKISAAGMRVFGSKPFPRYIYHFRVPRGNRGGGAGLEHLNSTVIFFSAQAMLRRSPGALSLVAHEFVHAWNVKRIRPSNLGPFDYSGPVRVKDLWWLEGVTDYYAPRLVVEAGLRGQDYWKAYVASQIGDLQNNDSRKKVTLEKSSVEVWEDGSSEGVDGLSYYNKGLVVGLLLDLEMRRLSSNKVGLDDLMKALYAQVAKTGKGYDEGEIERLASKLTGADLSGFFARALRSTDELAYKDALDAAGLVLDEQITQLPSLGVQWDFAAIRRDKAPIAEVVAEGPAAKAGIEKGDAVTAVDGKGIESLFGPFIRDKRPGDVVTLTIDRNGTKKEIPVTLGTREERTYRLIVAPNPSKAQVDVLNGVAGKNNTASPVGE